MSVVPTTNSQWYPARQASAVVLVYRRDFDRMSIMATNIFGAILVWSTQLAGWQNEAIRKLFRKGVLTPADKDELFRRC